jgi:hypothetical protein
MYMYENCNAKDVPKIRSDVQFISAKILFEKGMIDTLFSQLLSWLRMNIPLIKFFGNKFSKPFIAHFI